MSSRATRAVVIGAGVGGLTTAIALAQHGLDVTVLEAQTYPGGSAGTFFHQGYRFDAGATIAGGFQAGGPHALVAERLGVHYPVHPYDPAWVFHMPGLEVALTRANDAVLQAFPHSQRFWQQQGYAADLAWRMAGQGLPWPPTSAGELGTLARTALRNMPGALALAPLAVLPTRQWLRAAGADRDPAFVRFVDAQLLISAQDTTPNVYGLYAAIALDLARQGVVHAEGGMGGLSEALVTRLQALGGRVLYRQHVTGVTTRAGRAVGVVARRGRRAKDDTLYEADVVVANLTPWSLDALLAENSPARLRAEAQRRQVGLSAFVLHVGVDAAKLPADLPDHHQILVERDGPLGEGRSLFVSMSPAWDATRAPAGHRAVTISTHTRVQPWWDVLAHDTDAYHARKHALGETMIAHVGRFIPGFADAVRLCLPGSPVTYAFYTGRHLGAVGGFPAHSLLGARGPRTGVPNVWLVGDSIFPGQSTAGVSIGALRVADAVVRALPRRAIPVTQRQQTAEPL